MQDNIKEQIIKIKTNNNIAIISHNYTTKEVQDVSDFCGDTLEMCNIISKLNKNIIIVCGVKFMAETIKVLHPQKTILMPVKDSICPMADMINIETLNRIKQQYPNAITVCYVNSRLEMKIASNICCTSSNAESIINNIPKNHEIIFIPDSNMGLNIKNKTKRKNIIVLDGYCPVHENITIKMIIERKKQYPDGIVIAHPECKPEVIKYADKMMSTGKMVKFIAQTDINTVIVATESGIIYKLKKENPNKNIIPISKKIICSNIKKINITNIFKSITNMQHEIHIEKNIIELAKKPIINMLKYN